MPTPVKNLDNMSKHLTKDELEARAAAQALGLPCRKPKKPKLITQDKAASRHWARILKDMQDLEILDVLDTDSSCPRRCSRPSARSSPTLPSWG